MKTLQIAAIIDMLYIKDSLNLKNYCFIDLSSYLIENIDNDDLNDIENFKNEIEKQLLKLTNKQSLNNLAAGYRILLNDVYDFLENLKQ